MSDNEFEENLKEIISHSNDEDFLAYLEQSISENSSDLQYLQLGVSYFPSFESEPLIYYFLSIFRIWINSDIEIDLELLSEIKNIFFSQMRVTSLLIESIQKSGQIQTFLKVYPNLIPTFWFDFFENEIPVQSKLSFIEEFLNLFLKGQLRKDRASTLLNSMEKDDSELALVRYLLTLVIEEKDENALMLLAKNLALTDPFENTEENELMNTICTLINEHILPIALENLTQIPTSIIEVELNEDDTNQLKIQLTQIITDRHQSFNHIENLIVLLYHLIASRTSQFTVIDQIISELCEKIQSIYKISMDLLNQLFDIQNSPLVIDIYKDLEIDLNEDVYSILASISNFVSRCTMRFNEEAEFIEEFSYPFSLSLLQVPNDEVSLPVIDFLKKFAIIDRNEEKVTKIFFALGNRLTIYFANNSIENETNGFYLSLLDSFKSIFSKVGKQMNILDDYVSSILTNKDEYIQSIIDSSELKMFKEIEPKELELPLVSSMLQILITARDKFINFSQIEDVLTSCKYLFDFRAPISSQQFFTITLYMDYIVRVQSMINDDDSLFQLMFNSIFSFLTFEGNLNDFSEQSEEMEQTSDLMKQKFASILSDLIKFRMFYEKVEIKSDQIFDLVKTGWNDIIMIAAKIISKIPDNKMKFNVFQQCLDEMVSLFSSSDDQIQSILSILSFIGYQPVEIDDDEDEEEDNEYINLVVSFYNELFKPAFTNEQVLIEYLKSIQKVLDEKGRDIFLLCINKIYDEASPDPNSSCCFSIEIVTTICEIANLYIQLDQNDEWKSEAFCKIFDMVSSFQDFDEQDWSCQQSEEVKEVTNLFQIFFLLAAHSCNYLNAQKNIDILNYIEKNSPILFQLFSTESLCNSLNYLCSLTSFLNENIDELSNEDFNQIQILVGKFIEMTFEIIKIEGFSMIPMWNPVSKAIFKFHRFLVSLSPDEAVEQICFYFNQFPQSELLAESREKYIQLLHSEETNEITNEIEIIFQFLHDTLEPSVI